MNQSNFVFFDRSMVLLKSFVDRLEEGEVKESLKVVYDSLASGKVEIEVEMMRSMIHRNQMQAKEAEVTAEIHSIELDQLRDPEYQKSLSRVTVLHRRIADLGHELASMESQKAVLGEDIRKAKLSYANLDVMVNNLKKTHIALTQSVSNARKEEPATPEKGRAVWQAKNKTNPPRPNNSNATIGDTVNANTKKTMEQAVTASKDQKAEEKSVDKKDEPKEDVKSIEEMSLAELEKATAPAKEVHVAV